MPAILQVAFLLIAAGGLSALLLVRWNALMRVVSVLVTAAGCLCGLAGALRTLFQAGPAAPLVFRLRLFTFVFAVDRLTAFFLGLIFAISLLTILYSYHYLQHSGRTVADAVHTFFFALLVLSMGYLVGAGNMVSFALSWEAMSISSFLLVMYRYQDPQTRIAGFWYFVFSQAGAMAILAAFAVIQAHTGSFGFDGMSVLPDRIKLIVFLLFFAGFGSKAGVFPLHIWLPYAHPAAPSHVSALMSGVMIKIGIYGLLRFYLLLQANSLIVGKIVLAFGIVSGLMGIVLALGQNHLKTLLAYSSVENIGIILMGLGTGMIGVSIGKPGMSALGFAGCLLHIINHAVFKSLLFLGAGVVLHRTGTDVIDRLGGLLKPLKITGTAFLVGALAICGLPPFNGFVSEFLIYLAGFRSLGFDRTPFLIGGLTILTLVIIGGLALACFTKVFGIVFLGTPRNADLGNSEEKGALLVIPQVVLVGLCLLIGLAPFFFVEMATLGISVIPGAVGPVQQQELAVVSGHLTWAAWAFLGLTGLILAVRALLYRHKPVSHSGTWGCGFTRPTPRIQYTGSSFALSILKFLSLVTTVRERQEPLRELFPVGTHYQAGIDDPAETKLIRYLIRPTLAISDRVRWIQHGDIHLYIAYILIAIIVLLFFI